MPQNLSQILPQPSKPAKPPRSILPNIFAFAPHKDILGGTAYFIVNTSGNILLDCPAWNEINQQFLITKGGVEKLIITHRNGISPQINQIKTILQCEVIIQEQEAYLLPEISLTSFKSSLSLDSAFELIWTPGYSPGSSCLHWQKQNGVLFSGRHLLPTGNGEIAPLRTAKTFHWFRQLDSMKLLIDRFNEKTLKYICPGANTGFLRGKGYIDRAYQKLSTLDLSALRQTKPIM
ncbi:MAG: MBL fold metallo-hydrolase [Xenococcaceae cyanobacterium]